MLRRKEWSLTHQTLLGLLTVGGAPERVLWVLGWWCSEDGLHAKLSRSYTYSFQFFLVFCFFFAPTKVCSTFPVPGLGGNGCLVMARRNGQAPRDLCISQVQLWFLSTTGKRGRITLLAFVSRANICFLPFFCFACFFFFFYFCLFFLVLFLFPPFFLACRLLLSLT